MTNLRTYIAALIATLTLPTAAAAGNAGGALSNSDLQQRRLPSSSQRLEYFVDAPGLMHWRDSFNISTASLDGTMTRAARPATLQEGSGETLGTIGAHSYMHLDKSNTVWGSASYTAGRFYDQSWSNSVDYLLLAPYVLGDSVGGDIQQRTYNIAGGWAAGKGKWAYGLQASYRAMIGHRSRDPRIKDIVSDLDITAGVSRILGNYIAGLGGGVTIYHQDSDLDFYNPLNDINTYPLTGLGTYNQRFMGNNNKSSGHTLTSWHGAVTLLPRGTKGLSANIALASTTASLQLRSFNNITLGKTSTLDMSGCLQWSQPIGHALLLFPTLQGSLTSRSGQENLFGSAVSGSYELIGSRSIYRYNTLDARFTLPLQWTVTPGRIVGASLGALYDRMEEKLLDTGKLSLTSHYGFNGSLYTSVAFNAATFIEAGIDATALKSINPKLDRGNIPHRTGPTDGWVYNHTYRAASRWDCTPRAALFHDFDGKIAGISYRCNVVRYHRILTSTTHQVSLSVTF